MEDYKEEIKKLLQKYYDTLGEDDNKIYKTTVEILEEVRGVIPFQPIDDHDIYELMKELNFWQDQEIIFEKVCIFEGDSSENIPPEYDNVEVERVFKWVLFRK